MVSLSQLLHRTKLSYEASGICAHPTTKVLDGAVEVVDTTDTGAGATVVDVDDGATVVAGAHSAFRGSVGSGYGHACTA